ncbi:Transport permease protein [Flavobacterium longum]|uniref:ABC transporter permease n=1 Tax=Flavobacterium longum TaxID=1299340 RepID=UPI0039EC2DD6
MEQKQHWTEEIKSRDGLMSVNLREVWHYRDLLLMLLKRDFITFYKQTILGPIWFFLQPLMTTAMYVIIFGRVAKISTDGAPQIVFYLAGVTVWNYFSDSLTKTSTVFKDNASVFGKVYFPRLIMPLSIVFSALLKFAIQFLLFVAFVLYYTYVEQRIQPNAWVLMTPVLILMMAAFALGLGMIFSSMTTKYKDLTFLLTFGIQLFMFATPVIYPVSTISPEYRDILALNPLTSIFECFRYAYLGVGEFDPISLLPSVAVIVVLLVTGVVIFNKVEKSFMDTV